jgi:hypothetical protein
VEGTNTNTLLELRDSNDNNEAICPDRAIGRYGIPHGNAAGRNMHHMFGMTLAAETVHIAVGHRRPSCFKEASTILNQPIKLTVVGILQSYNQRAPIYLILRKH